MKGTFCKRLQYINSICNKLQSVALSASGGMSLEGPGKQTGISFACEGSCNFMQYEWFASEKYQNEGSHVGTSR